MSRNTQIVRLAVLLAAVVGLAALSGCATKGDIESLRSQIKTLQATTAQALSEAKAARDLSSANQQELDDVRQTAQSAVRMAEDNDLKLNQAFNQSLRK